MKLLTWVSTPCLIFEQKTKFSRQELHVKLSKVRPSRKRKRSNSYEVVNEKVGAKAIEERMESTTLLNLDFAALVMASLF